MNLYFKTANGEELLATINAAFRPMLSISDKYSDFNEMIEFLKMNDIIVYDEYDITTMDWSFVAMILKSENIKNKYSKSLIESDEEVENISLNTLSVITEEYYIDESGFLWIKN